MSNIRFRSVDHQDFFLEMMNKSRVNDCYHRAFFYVMGIAAETRANISGELWQKFHAKRKASGIK